VADRVLGEVAGSFLDGALLDELALTLLGRSMDGERN
jgi:hypothetical protein